MSLFGNSYEDAVYRTRYPRKYTDMENDWYLEKHHVVISVDINGITRAEVSRIITRLVNYPISLDDYDIDIDDDTEEEFRDKFLIIGDYDDNKVDQITNWLNENNLNYDIK